MVQVQVQKTNNSSSVSTFSILITRRYVFNNLNLRKAAEKWLIDAENSNAVSVFFFHSFQYLFLILSKF